MRMTKTTMGRLLASASAALLLATTIRAEEARHEDHEALRRLRDTFQEAAARNDLDLMKPYLATNFSIVTFTDREFLDFDTFKAQWQKTRTTMVGDGGTYRVVLNPEYSVLLDDIALCRGNSSNVIVTARGVEFKFTSHWSVVCQKTDGQWKVVRGHNSLNPFRNPMMEHAVRGIVIKVAGGALVVGLAIGAAAVWFAYPRSAKYKRACQKPNAC